MPALHIVNHAPALSGCVSVAQHGDTIVLIEEGVRAAVEDQARRVLVLEEDLAARPTGQLGANVQRIDLPAFVELVASHTPIVTWR
jgi:sulfur relay protein TusB/DsrH